MDKRLENASAVERIIRYSLYIWEMGLALLQLRKLKTMINSIGHISNTMVSNLDEIEAALTRRRDELNNACRLLLLPLLEGKDFGHKCLNRYYFGQNEIKDGYLLFEEVKGYTTIGLPVRNGKKYVLLLTPYYNKQLGAFDTGVLYDYEQVKSFIDMEALRPAMEIYKHKVKSVFDSMQDSIGNALIYMKIR